MDSKGRIRVATPADADAIRSIYAPFVASTPISFEETPPSETEIEQRIEKTLETHPWLVCERDGDIVGYAKAGPLRSMAAYRWTVELSVYVAPDARQCGVATGLYTSLLEILDIQGYRSAYAAVTVPNPASDEFHECLGFEPVGVFPRVGYTEDEWRDVQWLYRPVGASATASDREPFEPSAHDDSTPEDPLTFPEVQTHSGWEQAVAAGEAALEF